MKRHQMGEFRDRLTLLRLQSSPDAVTWEPVNRPWAKTERQNSGSIFSKVGLSAEGWDFIIRKQEITVNDAFLFGGKHHFITAIIPEFPGFLQVKTARVKIVQCQADPVNAGVRFPAALTEKYIRHEQHMPNAVNTTCFVLVTPKVVDLDEGALVDVDGTAYEVQVGHRLDEFKNEFEIVRKADC